MEKGCVLSCAGVSAGAQPYFAALLRHLFPQRPIVVITEGLRTQESAQQDLATWFALTGEAQSQAAGDRSQNPEPSIPDGGSRITDHASRLPSQPLFYPSWEVLPHEVRLPHADVISERLETLVVLTHHASRITHPAPLVVTSVVALLQRTFPAGTIRGHTRTLTRGDWVDPLDLVEWLEEQGYEPEAQVTQKGEIALRGGILDVFPLTSPWPVRLEFFGDELESLRHFDPLTQMSREQIGAVTIPPAGELSLLKRMLSADSGAQNQDPQPSTLNPQPLLGTLLDYLPAETVLLLCEPELLAERANEYAQQVPEGDPFFIPWKTLQEQAQQRGMIRLEVSEAESGLVDLDDNGGVETSPDVLEQPGTPHSALRTPHS
jgi:transcription-repair coupling factor (superfamily II helicase)